MLKKTLLFFLILTVLMVVHPTVEATTGAISTVQISSTMTNPSYIGTADDGSGAETGTSGGTSTLFLLDSTGKPTNLDFSQLDYRIRGKNGHASPYNVIFTQLKIYEGAGCSGAGTNVGGSNTVPTNTSWTINTTQYIFTNDAVDLAFIEQRLCLVMTVNSSYATKSYVDSFNVTGYYTVPDFSFSLDSSTASVSAGLVLLDMSGSFATNSASMTCEITLFENCGATDFAGWTSQTPVAHVGFVGGEPRTTTEKYSDGYYWGESDLSTNDSWAFHDVAVPYNTGFSCSYPISYNCYHRECTSYLDEAGGAHSTCGSTIIDASGQGLASGSEFYNDTFIATPSATQNAPEDLQIDCGTDIMCTVITKIKQVLYSFFVPSHSFSQIAFSQTKDSLTTHAPFAYIYPIFDFSSSDPSTSSAVPTIIFTSTSLGSTITGGIDGSLTAISSTITTFKTFLRFTLYLGFIIYLVLLIRRVLPQ